MNNQQFQSLKTRSTNNLFLIVDTTQTLDCYEYVFWVEKEKKYYPGSKVWFYVNNTIHSIESKLIGQVVFKGYPVFIVNVSDTSIRLRHRKYQVPLIQEALDSDGRWKPIELIFTPPEGMPLRDYAVSPLNPGQMVVTSLYQYKGDFQTLLRARIVVDGNVYTSEPLKGSINHSQISSKATYRFN